MISFSCESQSTKSTNKVSLDINPAEVDTATFAGGCFWCVEAVFDRVQGVEEAVSGYAGGDAADANYQDVSYGRTEHAETVNIYYDPNAISYEELLEIFMNTHDPTQLNRQGPDIGKQYRSAIFYHNQKQKKLAQQYMRELGNSGKFEDPIVTQLNEFEAFYDAEDYHQDYYEHNPDNRYVQSVTRPKVEKFKKEFRDKLKPEYR